MTVSVLIRPPRVAAAWRAGRVTALVALVALLAGLVLAPRTSLAVLWYVAVPVLPATFFLNPALWRGICPLATLNEWGNRLGRPSPPSARATEALGWAGLGLFYLMVPARHFLFNTHGGILAITVIAVGAIALGLGAVFAVRSGFCNALCPVLPVELLYGQRPLVRMERGRCGACTICTTRGCLDLSPGKAFSQVMGASRRSMAWLLTPFGLFVAALPGFIVAYGEIPDGPLSRAPAVYATILLAAVASWLVIGAVVRVLRVPSRVAFPAIAALAGGLYYWYAGPTVTGHLAIAPAWSALIRAGGIGLIGWWLFVTVSGGRRRGSAAPGTAS